MTARKSSKAFLTVGEMAAEIGVSESTVWRLLRSGEFKSVARGGRRLIARSESERRVQSKTSKNAGRPLTADHPMWRLIGAFRGDDSLPGSEDKYGALNDD